MIAHCSYVNHFESRSEFLCCVEYEELLCTLVMQTSPSHTVSKPAWVSGMYAYRQSPHHCPPPCGAEAALQSGWFAGLLDTETLKLRSASSHILHPILTAWGAGFNDSVLPPHPRGWEYFCVLKRKRWVSLKHRERNLLMHSLPGPSMQGLITEILH